MILKEWKSSLSGRAILALLFLNAIFFTAGFAEDAKYYLALLVSVPLLFFAIFKAIESRRNN